MDCISTACKINEKFNRNTDECELDPDYDGGSAWSGGGGFQAVVPLPQPIFGPPIPETQTSTYDSTKQDCKNLRELLALDQEFKRKEDVDYPPLELTCKEKYQFARNCCLEPSRKECKQQNFQNINCSNFNIQNLINRQETTCDKLTDVANKSSKGLSICYEKILAFEKDFETCFKNCGSSNQCIEHRNLTAERYNNISEKIRDAILEPKELKKFKKEKNSNLIKTINNADIFDLKLLIKEAAKKKIGEDKQEQIESYTNSIYQNQCQSQNSGKGHDTLAGNTNNTPSPQHSPQHTPQYNPQSRLPNGAGTPNGTLSVRPSNSARSPSSLNLGDLKLKPGSKRDKDNKDDKDKDGKDKDEKDKDKDKDDDENKQGLETTSRHTNRVTLGSKSSLGGNTDSSTNPQGPESSNLNPGGASSSGSLADHLNRNRSNPFKEKKSRKAFSLNIKKPFSSRSLQGKKQQELKSLEERQKSTSIFEMIANTYKVFCNEKIESCY